MRQLEQEPGVPYDLPAAPLPAGDGATRQRLLVLIVAYEAESSIASVIARIPNDIPGVETSVLVLDDGSLDGTFEAAAASDTRLPVKVLRNPLNQGYGGNQKIGYHYALAHGFDHVALIHGDGQYGPEHLPRLMQPLLAGQADAVLGSRMIDRRGAIEGGMPLYKFVGNRVLTMLQNAMTGAGLHEYHTGYRIYAVDALRRIPFQRNTDDFHFDTEILLQLMGIEARIEELPIPTFYGDEICRVNGLSYAAKVLATTFQWRIRATGLLQDPKYPFASGHAVYQPKLDFPSTHSWVVAAVPAGATVLDIGCSDGHVAAALAAKGCRVIGVDQGPPADPRPFARFLQHDLDTGLPDPEERIDYVLALDVIEHLRTPERLIEEIHLLSSRNREMRLVISTGNVAFCVVRGMLLLGQFNYGPRGILDATHTRLFTFGSLRRALRDGAFEVERTVGIPAPFPLALGRNRFAMLMLRLNAALIRLSRGMFAYQMLMVCRPAPALDWLLEDAVEESLQRRQRADATGAATVV
jgi:glycosyltransferase involved in cell wall biosynthesis